MAMREAIVFRCKKDTDGLSRLCLFQGYIRSQGIDLLFSGRNGRHGSGSDLFQCFLIPPGSRRSA